MNWNMMDLAVKHLNVSALKEWKNTVLEMSVWMQAIMVGVLVLLIGASLLSLFWGLKMTRSAKFAAGSTSVFQITLIILIAEYSMENQKALIISAIAGVAAGFIYAFLERVFQFAAGFVFGSVLAAWLLPEHFHMKLDAQPGRIWQLVIAIAAGALFALIAKKLRFILTALEGGIVLGLLCDVFLPVHKIPWVSEKLTKAQIWNLLPFVIAGAGLLIQFFQWIAMIREQRALQIPSGEERDNVFAGNGGSQSEEKTDADETALQNQDDEIISMAAAEEVLVEKARELALAASKSAQNARLKERYADVAEGMYSAEVAAKRLGITEEEFLEGMKRSGYLPESEGSADSEDKAGEDQSEDGASAQKAEASDSERMSEAGKDQSSLTADETSAESQTDAAEGEASESKAEAVSDEAGGSEADAASESKAEAASNESGGSEADAASESKAEAVSNESGEGKADPLKKDPSSEIADSKDADPKNPSEDDEKTKGEDSENAAGSDQAHNSGHKKERSGRRKHKKH